MATRDLTRKFEALRNERVRIRRLPPAGHETDPLHAQVGPVETALSPEWVDIVSRIRADLNQVNENLVLLKKAYNERLRVSFGDDQVADQERDIEIITQKITKLLRDSENNVKRVAGAGHKTGLQLTSQERVTRINVMRAVAAQLQEYSRKFRQAQKEFLKDMQSQTNLGEAFGLTDTSSSSADLNDIIDKGLTPEHAAQLQALSDESEQRYKQIIKVAQSVNELATLFKELNVLVVEQGSILDRIDYNIEQTLIKVQQGKKELVTAEKHSEKAYMIKCAILLFIIAFIMLIIFIWKKSSGS